jgi:glycosyltransferase involved in cell wall biosynthesis
MEFGIAPQKVHVWHQGVEKERFYPADRALSRSKLGLAADRHILLWVGRLVSVKGVDILLKASAALRGRLDFHLYLIGDGPLKPTLHKQAAELRLYGTVSFLGSRPNHELPDWYRAADLTVLPSRSEGLPNVLRESLACGTSFVASRVGSIAEIAQKPWDQLVPRDDPNALADAIARALQQSPSQVRPPFQCPSWEESAEALLRLVMSRMCADTVGNEHSPNGVGSRAQAAPAL